MVVLYCDEIRNETLEKELGAQKVDFKDLLKQEDYVSIHVPLLKETHHLIDDKALRLMKKTAYLLGEEEYW